MDHFPAQMSGGEQQRVAIARAIAKRPDVLLCDEPTGALDSKTGIRVLEALSQVNQELGTTTALITHNAAIQDMAHRVMLFGDGRITANEDQRNAQAAVGDQLVSPMRMLDRKLLRDLRRMWAQALAIALVMASGVATYVLAQRRLPLARRDARRPTTCATGSPTCSPRSSARPSPSPTRS